MTDQYREIAAVLRRVRVRWRAVRVLLGIARGFAGAAAVLLLALAAWTLGGSGRDLLLVSAAAALVGAVAAVAWGFARIGRAPSDRLVARLIEERCPALEDRVASAVEFGAGAGAERTPMLGRLLDDTARRLAAVDLDTIVSRRAIRQAAGWAAAAALALAAAVAIVRAPAARALELARFTLFPSTLTLQVTPGDARVPIGTPLQIAVTIPSRHGGLVPTLEFGGGDRWRQVAMQPAGVTGRYTFTFATVTSGFRYRVAAGQAASRRYAVTVLQPPHVTRIDLQYRYPARLGLPSRTETDGGDIYAPPGTRVRLRITTSEPVASGALTLDGRQRLPLASLSRMTLEGEIDVRQDGSYRVALAGLEGLKNPGDTEYFIRTLAHRPPDVRIIRPAQDRQVTPLEEVAIEAHADAEFGVGRFDLVYSLPGGAEKVVPFAESKAGQGGVDGQYLLYLENLHVKPGDLISYYARAHDRTRSGAAGAARSDIFFLEVQPFEEAFAAAQSQTQGLAGGQNRSIDDLVAAQKDIVVATWRLDRRSRAADRQSAQDIRSVGQAQAALRTRTREQIGQFDAAMMRDPRQPQPPGDPGGVEAAAQAMNGAATAMGRAVTSLDGLETGKALPHEMDALNQLLKAQAEVRRRQVTQQASGPAQGDYRRNLDLSTLFDRELQRLQQTNYETPPASEPQADRAGDRALDRVRELARRQDDLARRQQALAKQRAKLGPDEMKRQLERLTRDQSELRRQAEDLARQLKQQAPNGAAGSQSAAGQQMDAVSNAMGAAAGELRRQNPRDASAQAGRAGDELRRLAEQMADGAPAADPTWRAVGDLRLQTRELADAERQMASQLRQFGQGAPARDALRRLATAKQRLADQARQIERRVAQLNKEAGHGTPDRAGTRDRAGAQALAAAARELAKDHLSERMRRSASEMHQAAAGGARIDPAARADAEQQLGQALDRVSQALSAAGATGREHARRLAEQLARVQSLRDRLNGVQRQLDQLAKAARTPQSGDGKAAAKAPGERGRDEGERQGRTPGSKMAGLEQLRDQLLNMLRQTQEMVEARRREGDVGLRAGLGFTPEGQGMVLSSPGTEAFKQDFARWASLRRNANAALAQMETALSQRLQAQVRRDRLAAGGDDRAPASYRSLVDSYFKALADKDRQKPRP